jgi:hypothetical protein
MLSIFERTNLERANNKKKAKNNFNKLCRHT